MINLVIDSSEIESGSPFSPAINSALKTLVKYGEIKIHLPNVIYREVTTRIQSTCINTSQSFTKLVKRFDNIFRLSPSIKIKFDLLVKQSEELSKLGVKEYVENFNDLIKELNIEVYKKSSSYTDDVLEVSRPE